MTEINKDDPFGQCIIKVLKTFRIHSMLEIGSWDGLGSTSCIIEGLNDVKEKSLDCLEINKERFSALLNNTEKYSWISCHNESSISYKSLMYKNFEEVWNSPYNHLPKEYNPKEIVKGWFDRDSDELKKIEVGFLEKNNKFYDAVLIDGGEFVGYSEYTLLKSRTNFFILDDSFHAFKTSQITEELAEDPEWQCLAHGNVRNGFAIFKRKNLI